MWTWDWHVRKQRSPPSCLLQFKVGLEGGVAGGKPSVSKQKSRQSSEVKKEQVMIAEEAHCDSTVDVSHKHKKSKWNGNDRGKKENRIRKYLLFLSPPKYGMSHSTDMSRIQEQALTYQRSPFCSSGAYSRDGKSTQIHPWCSHSPAHNRHCSHCTRLYLRGKMIIRIAITRSVFACFGFFLQHHQQRLASVCLFYSLRWALVCYAQLVMCSSLHPICTHLRSGPVHTWCSLCCRDTENRQGSSHMCDHMSARKNTHLYL